MPFSNYIVDFCFSSLSLSIFFFTDSTRRGFEAPIKTSIFRCAECQNQMFYAATKIADVRVNINIDCILFKKAQPTHCFAHNTFNGIYFDKYSFNIHKYINKNICWFFRMKINAVARSFSVRTMQINPVK